MKPYAISHHSSEPKVRSESKFYKKINQYCCTAKAITPSATYLLSSGDTSSPNSAWLSCHICCRISTAASLYSSRLLTITLRYSNFIFGRCCIRHITTGRSGFTLITGKHLTSSSFNSLYLFLSLPLAISRMRCNIFSFSSSRTDW